MLAEAERFSRICLRWLGVLVVADDYPCRAVQYGFYSRGENLVKISRGFEERSRLGRLLVNRGYLSESQLEDGLRLQKESGLRLGEVLIDAGWVAEKDLLRALKHQHRYRNAAALVAMVTIPLQPLVGFAATGNGSGNGANSRMGGVVATEYAGLTPMDEDEMAGVSGQSDHRLFDQIVSASSMVDVAFREEGAVDADAEGALKLTANIFVPVLSFLDSDFSISGVHYREGEPGYALSEDGGIALALPERIEQIRMDNIRVSGSQGASMGNVTITDIRFDPAASMTIYAR